MSANNSITVIGRMGRDPEMNYTPSGMAIAKFSMAVDKFNSKTQQREAMWLNVVCFGKLAERVTQWAQKGTMASATGKLDISNYTSKDGAKQTWIEVVADDIELLAGFKTKDQINGGESPRASRPTNQPSQQEAERWAAPSENDAVDLGRPF